MDQQKRKHFNEHVLAHRFATSSYSRECVESERRTADCETELPIATALRRQQLFLKRERRDSRQDIDPRLKNHMTINNAKTHMQ